MIINEDGVGELEIISIKELADKLPDLQVHIVNSVYPKDNLAHLIVNPKTEHIIKESK